jgi:hypothetical protein
MKARRLVSADVLALAGLVLVTGLAFRREIFLHQIVLVDDQIWQYYPIRTYAAAVLRTGQLPLWTPYLWGGFPLLADAIATPFYPLRALMVVWPEPIVAFVLLYMLNILLAGLFMYGLLRALDLRPLAAFAGASAFMLSGFLVSQLKNATISETMIWLPLEAWMLERCLRHGKLRYAALGGLALALQLFAGHSQIALMSLLAAGSFVALRTLLAPASEWSARSGSGMRGAFRRAAWAAQALVVMLVIGMGIGAVQLVPFVELFVSGVRGLGFWDYYTATQTSYPPPALVNVLFPYFFRFEHTAELHAFWGWGFLSPYELDGYVGSACLALSAAAIMLHSSQRRFAWGVALLAVLFLLFAMGDYTSAYHLIYALPGLHSARIPARFLGEAQWYVALLSALGLQALGDLAGDRRQARALIWVSVCTALIIGLAVVAARWVIDANPAPVQAYLANTFLQLRNTNPEHPEMLYQQLQRAVDVTRSDTAWPLALCALTAATLIGWYRSARPQRWLVVLVGVESLALLYGADFYTRVPIEDVQSQINAATVPVTERLAPDSFERVYSGGFPPLTTRIGPNTLLPQRIAELSGYTFVTPLRWEVYNDHAQIRRGCPINLLDLGGVRYIWLHQPWDAPAYQVGDSLGNGCHARAVWTDQEYVLLQNRNPLPRAFLVARATPARTPGETLAALEAPGADLRSTALVEGLARPLFSGSPAGQARITRYADQEVVIETDSAATALLVLTDSYWPGWRVTVDDQRTPLYRTDYLYRGVIVPAGKHVVRFWYDPLSFRLGLALTLATLLLAASLILENRFSPRVLLIAVAGAALAFGLLFDWREMQYQWSQSAQLADQVTAQLAQQYPGPEPGTRVYLTGLEAMPGPAWALAQPILSPLWLEDVYPGRGVTAGNEVALVDSLVQETSPWRPQPSIVAYRYADGTFLLTSLVYGHLTGDRLVDLSVLRPAAGRPPALFADWLELRGSEIVTQAYNLDPEGVPRVFLRTRWQLRAPAPRNYTLYVHLTVPGDDALVGQADHALAVWVTGAQRDAYLSEWPVGLEIADYVELAPDLLARAPRLDVRVGVWQPESGEHLAVASQQLPIDSSGRLMIASLP